MRYLIIIFSLFLSSNLYAEEQKIDEFVEISCNDEKLLQQVKQKIAKLQTENNSENIVDRRSRLLAMKNIDNFSPIDVVSFKPGDNYRVANRMISIKINKKIKETDLRLCVSDNPILERKIYLLMYPLDGQLKIEIINYTSNVNNSEPFIFYKK